MYIFIFDLLTSTHASVVLNIVVREIFKRYKSSQIIWSCVLKSSNVFYFKQKNNEDCKTIWSSSCLSLTSYPTNLYLAHFSLNGLLGHPWINKILPKIFYFFFSLPVVLLQIITWLDSLFSHISIYLKVILITLPKRSIASLLQLLSFLIFIIIWHYNMYWIVTWM